MSLPVAPLIRVTLHDSNDTQRRNKQIRKSHPPPSVPSSAACRCRHLARNRIEQLNETRSQVPPTSAMELLQLASGLLKRVRPAWPVHRFGTRIPAGRPLHPAKGR
jgi:hypothetical protein